MNMALDFGHATLFGLRAAPKPNPVRSQASWRDDLETSLRSPQADRRQSAARAFFRDFSRLSPRRQLRISAARDRGASKQRMAWRGSKSPTYALRSSLADRICAV
jgi:hypothetical protein